MCSPEQSKPRTALRGNDMAYNANDIPKVETVAIDKTAAIRIATVLGWEPKREWVGLNWDDLPEIYVGDTAFLHGAKWAEVKLKEKNGA